MNKDFDYIINNATKMHTKLHFRGTNKVQTAMKVKYRAEPFKELTYKLLIGFIWAYRADYLAYGYNPYRGLKQLYDIILSARNISCKIR